MSAAHPRRGGVSNSLDETHVARDPLDQFGRWFEEALKAELPLANAMTLATASSSGSPSARMVLLKGADLRGFVFFSNYLSRKGRELSVNPHAALLFHWSELERQIRIEGSAERVSAEESDHYFATRPLASRYAAISSPQSEVMLDRQELEARYLQATREDSEPRRPEYWGGYRVVPQTIEFWQGRENRLHDRVLYTREADGWRIKRLAP